MQAKTDGVFGVVNFDNAAEFSQLLTALPSECRVSIAWGTPEATSGITFNRLNDKMKMVHMHFADNANHDAEYATLGKFAPISSFAWTAYPAVATVTNMLNSKQVKIDGDTLEIRYRTQNEPISTAEDQWITKLGVPVSVIEETKTIPMTPAVPIPATTTALVPVEATTAPTTTTTAPTTEAQLPKTPDLMPNKVDAKAEVIPETQAAAKEATITVKPMPTPVLPITKTEEPQKTNYLPWALGGIALLILLKR